MRQTLVDWVATAVTLLMVPALLIVLASVAFGARTPSSIWVDAPAPHFGDPFTVGYAGREREPWALVECWPNATTTFSSTYAEGTIWSSVFSLYPGGPSPQAFVAGESIYPLWTGGGADCVVSLLTYSRDMSRHAVHATAPFQVAP